MRKRSMLSQDKSTLGRNASRPKSRANSIYGREMCDKFYQEKVHHNANNNSSYYGFVVAAVAISLFTLAVRVVYVTDRRNWVTIHPDEVFQSIEVAHTEHYGYGFRTFEFSSHFDEVDDNITTRYRQMELEAGLSALRSPLFPYYYVFVAKIASLLGMMANPYLVFRLSHVFITSLLPLSVHFYVSVLFQSNYAGILAAILTASSKHLNILGSHCFVHSFLSPFIFIAFSLVAASANQRSQKEDATKPFLQAVQQQERHTDANNNSCDNPNQFSNLNIINKSVNPASHPMKSGEKEGSHGTSYYGRGYFEAFIRNVSSCHRKTLFTTNSKSQDLLKNFLAGFLTGTTCYIRPDAILIHCVNLFILLSKTKQSRYIIIFQGPIIFLGIVMSFLIGVSLDTRFYAGFTVTPLNWFTLNIARDVSTTVFGKMAFWSYFTLFYFLDVILCGFCILSFATCIGLSIFHRFGTHSVECTGLQHNEKARFALTQVIISLCSLLAIYSFHGHKEVRFIHDVIVIVCVFVALTISKVISGINSKNAKFGGKMAVLSVLILTSSSQVSDFLNHSSTTDWTFQHTSSTQDSNACLEFVSNRPDVRGIFLESNLFLTGGMTLLHKDVPIFSRVMNGFAEFDIDSRTNTTDHHSVSNIVTNLSTRSVNTFTRVSNYVSQVNGEGILRVILGSQNYNYLVTTNRQPFEKMDFRVVFQQGHTLVLRRSSDVASELRISQVVNRLTLGTNMTMLMHEGDVLFHMKRYEKAAARFRRVLSLVESSEAGTDVVGVYLPLHECLKEMGQYQEATKVMSRCADLYGKDECWKARFITRLY